MRRIIHDFFSYNDRVPRDLAKALADVMQRPEFLSVVRAVKLAQARGLRIYAVGGLPRDLVLGRPATDLDLVVEGDAVSLAHALADHFGGKVTSHQAFGTAKWELSPSTGTDSATGGPNGQPRNGLDLDLISARHETYSRPAALPHVSTGTIQDDLRRRDFPINAIAIRLDGSHFGTILDPLGGLDDLAHKRISVLHGNSFRDDPTRMFRAVRYAQRLDFRIDRDTLRQIPPARKWIRALSAHRIRHELERALAENNVAGTIRQLGALGLLRAVHTALPYDQATIRRIQPRSLGNQAGADTLSGGHSPEERWILWLMVLTPRQVRALQERLHFKKRLISELLAASELWHSAARLSRSRPSVISRQLEGYPLRVVRLSQQALPRGKSKDMLRRFLERWRHIQPLTSAADLQALGVAPGPAYRKVLQELRAGWIDGKIRTRAEEKEALGRLLRRL